MRSTLVAAVAAIATVTYAVPTIHEAASPQALKTRNIVEEIQDSYDFIVVGGGLAGLVLGSRLSEDANHTVLVLEAGGTGDDYRTEIDTPGLTYYESLWPTPLNWDFYTVPQAGANNSKCEWPRGKVLGGSSAINGLYLNRPGEIEVNAWKDLLGDMDGADNWSWESLFAAMKKSETFTPPSDAIAQEGGMTWNAASHGTTGPIHHSWPGYTFPLIGDWGQALPNIGIADSPDTYGGETWGGYVCLSSINPANWTRSYSKTGYLDPLPPRANYDVLVNAHVTRLLFNSSSPAGNLSANAVEYSPDGGVSKKTVKVNKEVILAGGTIGSPTVLLYSGVGPKDVLANAGVNLVSELPGVGQHLQDHFSVSVQWSTDSPTMGQNYDTNSSLLNDPAYLSFVNDAAAYVNSSYLYGNQVSTMQANIMSEMDNYAPTDKNVLAGYHAVYNTTANVIFPSQLGQIELLLYNNADGAIRMSASLQHPYSHGEITINSNDPMNYPVIDPHYFEHPADVTAMREGLKLVRRIGNTEPLKDLMTGEEFPGSQVNTDQEWEDWMRGQIFTEFHPSSTCSMLPLEQGGVVDANLKVYGLANVRVADASVPPFSFSAHLMASTYGIAEQASTIIRNAYNLPSTTKSSNNATTSSASGSSSKTTTSSGSSSSSTAKSGSSASSSVSLSHLVPTLLTITVFFVFGLSL